MIRAKYAERQREGGVEILPAVGRECAHDDEHLLVPVRVGGLAWIDLVDRAAGGPQLHERTCIKPAMRRTSAPSQKCAATTTSNRTSRQGSTVMDDPAGQYPPINCHSTQPALVVMTAPSAHIVL